ncbi:hypothetical protein CsSME_00003501 [Camellia sinensis var. sinensis]
MLANSSHAVLEITVTRKQRNKYRMNELLKQIMEAKSYEMALILIVRFLL